METKKIYAIVRQICAKETGWWYSEVLKTFSDKECAFEEIKEWVASIVISDPNAAVRELEPYQEDIIFRVGWLSKENALSMGQFLIIELPTL